METQQFGEQIKFYNNVASLQCQYVKSVKSSFPSINIEIIKKELQDYDYKNKKVVQINKNEYPAICKVLLGWMVSFKSKPHKFETNKAFYINNNSNGTIAFIIAHQAKINSNDGSSFILNADDRFEVAQYFVKRMAECYKISIPDCLNLLKAIRNHEQQNN